MSEFSRVKRIAVLLLLGLIAGTGCGVSPSEKHASEAQEVPRDVPQRIISLSPSVTEILAGVGAFDRVIAVSNYCNYPSASKNLPRVGSWLNFSFERVVALDPDLVVMAEAQAPFGEEALHRLGLRTLVVGSQSVKDALSAITTIGRAVGNDREGQELAGRVRAALAEVRTQTQGLSRPKVLCIVDRYPGTLRDTYAAAGGSFLAELVETAGGVSIAPPAQSPYVKISKEALLTLNPEVIIDMVQGAKGRLGENTEAVWQQLSDVRAVREGRIYPMRDSSVLHASQSVASTARQFARLIHPEVFGHEPDR